VSKLISGVIYMSRRPRYMISTGSEVDSKYDYPDITPLNEYKNKISEKLMTSITLMDISKYLIIMYQLNYLMEVKQH
jgi:hypothetical protein